MHTAQLATEPTRTAADAKAAFKRNQAGNERFRGPSTNTQNHNSVLPCTLLNGFVQLCSLPDGGIAATQKCSNKRVQLSLSIFKLQL